MLVLIETSFEASVLQKNFFEGILIFGASKLALARARLVKQGAKKRSRLIDWFDRSKHLICSIFPIRLTLPISLDNFNLVWFFFL